MKTPEDRRRHDVALFRYGLIAEIMALPPGPERSAALRAKAKRAHAIPRSRRTRVAVQTLRDWIRNYERDGFEGLMPKIRSDRAQPRRMSTGAIEILLSIKRDAPDPGVRQAIGRARGSGEIPDDMPLPPSTVHRLFAREGLMVQQSQPLEKDMRRFAFRLAGELWQADAMHGPRIADGRGRKRKTCPLAILDDATRLIPCASFAFADSTPEFLLALCERRPPAEAFRQGSALTTAGTSAAGNWPSSAPASASR